MKPTKLICFLCFTLSSGLCLSRGSTYDVRTFGAIGTDTTDDSQAFRDALAAATAANDEVYVPAGTYYIDSTVTATNGCILRGDGEHASNILARNAIDLISITLSSDASRFAISDVTLITSNVNAGTALSLTYSSGSPSQGLIANRFHINHTGGQSWATGIRLSGAKNSLIQNSMIASWPHIGIGVEIASDSSGTVFRGVWSTGWHKFLTINSSISSLTMDRCFLVDVNVGIYSPYNVGAFKFLNGHIDARSNVASEHCIDLPGGSAHAIIKNSLLSTCADQVDQPSFSGRYHLVLAGTATTIEGNHFYGQATAGGVVVLNGSSGVSVRGNYFSAVRETVNKALWLASGGTSAVAEGNNFQACGPSPILDQATGSLIQYNYVQ